ncbi:tenascin [Musca vetustissima]|uniref:tenascin n=1 Tax=Musca vetustissima TaxID=27455 RepID=UPI002AB6AA0D|nr:tenascin [Musca vetustissima]
MIFILIADLLELSCLEKQQCNQFEHSGIKADCLEGHCHCINGQRERVDCKPADRKLGNIIGSPCPCKMDFSECDTKHDTCYCAAGYMPSMDKRRCIKKKAMLGERCELDSQCQRGDYNAICHKESETCMCMDLFIHDAGKCVSIVGPKFECHNDTECLKTFLDNVRCNERTHNCTCVEGYIASSDNTRCQRISEYLEECSGNQQCIASMGLGGRCLDGSCQCDEKYYAEEKKYTDTGVKHTVCTPIVERGQYCRFSEDCYQRQLSNESQQSMDCVYGECNCKVGFFVLNEGECMPGAAMRVRTPWFVY